MSGTRGLSPNTAQWSHAARQGCQVPGESLEGQAVPIPGPHPWILLALEPLSPGFWGSEQERRHTSRERGAGCSQGTFDS